MKKMKYFKQMNNNHSYFLNPSKIFVSTRACEVVTVLGSCVSVCLYDRIRQIGGINHYMLPLWNGKELPSPKFGNIAIEKLIQKMIDQGALKKDLVAKVFGGAEVIQATNGMFRIGHKNIDIAYQILRQEGIRVVADSTGSQQGRKIMFRTSTGEVLMKYVKRQNMSQLININT